LSTRARGGRRPAADSCQRLAHDGGYRIDLIDAQLRRKRERQDALCGGARVREIACDPRTGERRLVGERGRVVDLARDTVRPEMLAQTIAHFRIGTLQYKQVV